MVERAVRPLPVDAILPDVVAALRNGRSLVVEAPPGAGKTTRIPPALLAAGLAGDGEVVVLEEELRSHVRRHLGRAVRYVQDDARYGHRVSLPLRAPLVAAAQKPAPGAGAATEPAASA